LDRLDGVQRHGKGCRAHCPACGGKSRKLSISQADDGRVLIHCFGGCPVHGVLAAIGLSATDLFERRIEASMSPAEQRAMREYARQAQWRAALDALLLEVSVVHIAARQIASGQSLDQSDLARVVIACDRIRDAREVLHAKH
jgi:hypothetical protein